MAQTESRVSWREWTLPEPAVFTCAPAPERLHNRAVGSLAETTHLGRLGGIGGSSLRPAPHTAPCSRTPCATPRMTTIYVHIPLGSDVNCLHPVRQAFLCFRKRGAAPRSVPRGRAEHLPVQSQSIGRKPKWEEQKSLRQQRPQAYACASRVLHLSRPIPGRPILFR